MKEKRPTYGELFDHLEASGLMEAKEREAASESLGKPASPGEPLYIKILIGAGAWVAALFFIIFLIVSSLLVKEEECLVWGIIFLVCGLLLNYKFKGVFPTQLALALVFSGNLLVVTGAAIIVDVDSFLFVAVLHGIICVLVYPFFSNSIYRFISPGAIAILLSAHIIEEGPQFFIHPLIMAEVILAGFLILRRKLPAFLEPLKYSAASMLPATLLYMNMTQIDIWGSRFKEALWPSSLILSLCLVYFFIRLAGGKDKLREPWMILTLVGTIVLGAFTTPGILVALGLLVAGFALGDRLLTFLSCIFFPCFLSLFYYALNVDLAYKSWVLGGSGVLLLIFRHIAGRLGPKEAK